jgi:hypothetical protein
MTLQTHTIERSPHDKNNPYVMISNELICDNSISPECRWILIYLLSFEGEGEINIAQLVVDLKDHMGRDKIRTLINEAIEAGYMKRESVNFNE